MSDDDLSNAIRGLNLKRPEYNLRARKSKAIWKGRKYIEPSKGKRVRKQLNLDSAATAAADVDEAILTKLREKEKLKNRLLKEMQPPLRTPWTLVETVLVF